MRGLSWHSLSLIEEVNAKVVKPERACRQPIIQGAVLQCSTPVLRREPIGSVRSEHVAHAHLDEAVVLEVIELSSILTVYVHT